MKTLIYLPSRKVFATICNGKVEVNNSIIRDVLEGEGIAIPGPLLKQFDNKELIFPSDALFSKAFEEVFVPFELDDASYKWVF
jgi:hypothetical protein